MEVYRNGQHYVVFSGGLYHSNDTEGCGPGLCHVGDSYRQKKHAIAMCDFWADGGHWMDRPDMDWVEIADCRQQTVVI